MFHVSDAFIRKNWIAIIDRVDSGAFGDGNELALTMCADAIRHSNSDRVKREYIQNSDWETSSQQSALTRHTHTSG